MHKEFPEATGTLAWLIDLAANWQILYLVLFLIGITLSTFRNWRYVLLLPLASLPWFTASEMASQALSDGELLKVANININFRNQEIEPLKDWITKKDADIVSLI